MSATIIALPAIRPPRDKMARDLTTARTQTGLAPTAERRAYFMGYIAGVLSQTAGLAPQALPKRRKV